MLLSTYLAILDDKFLTKVAQVFVDFLGCFKNIYFVQILLYLAIDGQLLKKIGTLPILSSGHT